MSSYGGFKPSIQKQISDIASKRSNNKSSYEGALSDNQTEMQNFRDAA